MEDWINQAFQAELLPVLVPGAKFPYWTNNENKCLAYDTKCNNVDPEADIDTDTYPAPVAARNLIYWHLTLTAWHFIAPQAKLDSSLA